MLAAVALGAWLIAAPRTPDLAAQVYRAQLFGRAGMAIWDPRWYAGHDLPGYSLLFPALAHTLGVRLVAVLAVLASVVLFDRLVTPVFGPRARWAVALFALAAAGDAWIGRLSFALGVTFALAAALAFARGRTGVAAALALVCAAASPVAGVMLGLAALTLSLWRRSPRPLLVLAVPAALVVVPLALLFPEGGFEPFPIRSFAATALVTLAFLCALPRREGLLRLGGAVFAAASVACLLVHSPIGSNVARYAVLLAGPLLLAATLRAPARDADGAVHARRGGVALAVAALALISVWVVWGPVRETAAASSADTSAAYYAPLERYFAGLGSPVRVEVPLTRSHWEAALLAPTVPLARGWEKQLEERYDGALLSHALDAASYRRWLEAQAVAYVALPDAPLDSSSAREGALVRGGLPYLREVFATTHWRVFRVLGATPLVSGPARVLAFGDDGFSTLALAPGTALVRVHFSRYLDVVAGRGCVRAGPEGWTRVYAPAPGVVRVAARFSLARAFGAGGGCRGTTGG